MGLQKVLERLPIHGLGAVSDHHRRPNHQWQQQLQHRNVEGQRGHRHQYIIGRQARFARHAGEKVHHRTVRYHHALGLAGGAGGVDDVGGILAVGVQRSVRGQGLIRL